VCWRLQSVDLSRVEFWFHCFFLLLSVAFISCTHLYHRRRALKHTTMCSNRLPHGIDAYCRFASALDQFSSTTVILHCFFVAPNMSMLPVIVLKPLTALTHLADSIIRPSTLLKVSTVLEGPFRESLTFPLGKEGRLGAVGLTCHLYSLFYSELHKTKLWTNTTRAWFSRRTQPVLPIVWQT
jgi:hypothetical protein